jgi:hypothetical protein
MTYLETQIENAVKNGTHLEIRKERRYNKSISHNKQKEGRNTMCAYLMVRPHQKDARGENTKINFGMDTTGEKDKRTPKKNVDGRSTSSHDNKKFRTRSMEKQRGMAFGFQKTATAVKKNRIDR